MSAGTEAPTAERLVRSSDRFSDDRLPGTVVGSIGPSGARRLGVDVERRIGIDNGALRMRPLEQPGWGRQGIAYGPFERMPGLAFAVHVLNGHNASQTFYFPETRWQRFRRGVSDIRHRRPKRQHHYENLAIGFLPAPDAADPLRGSHSFVMHAATEHNGELWVAHGGRPARVVRGVQNLPFLFVVALRDRGAAYYTSSLPGAVGATAYPYLRPVGIDPTLVHGPLVAGVQQRILGEVGYRVDTRVYGADVAIVEEWRHWYGSAMAADSLVGHEALDGRRAEAGGQWTADAGLLATPTGARLADPAIPAAGRLDVADAAGLVHVLVDAGRSPGRFELHWRDDHQGGGLAVVLTAAGCEVVERSADGRVTTLASDPAARLRPRRTTAVQVVDGDDERLAVHVDGRLVGDDWLRAWPTRGTTVGVRLEGDLVVRDLEVHPRDVPLPGALDCGAPWVPAPSAPPAHERFDRVQDDLAGSVMPGGRRWERLLGTGVIELHGGHGRVKADVSHPNPSRTIFAVPWDDPAHADVELEMTIPGTRRGEGHKGRCGVVFWEDPDNYLVVNVYVDDDFDGASVSTFYNLDGREDMYEAVWTLVQGVRWGRPCVLRASFDGERFLAGVNGEPSLVRALRDVHPEARRLRIVRVGIIVNEEWGDDTGTVLHRFSAAERAGH